MKLLHTATLTDDLKESSIFVDSTALIHAAQSDEFLTLLTEIRTAGCTFYTIPSVVYEYTRTANTLKGYEERLEFIKELGVIVFNRVEELLLKDSKVFLAAYNTEFKDGKKGPSYTDSILCTMAYKHRVAGSFVLTSNHKDMPLSMFDREELITLDIRGEFHVEALYKFSDEKFSKILSKLEAQEVK